MQRKRLRLLITVLPLMLGVALQAGCLSSRLSEEAKPVNTQEQFIVAVAEFNRVASEAELWLDGVLQQAEIGDHGAIAMLPIAQQIGGIIATGNIAIQQTQALIDDQGSAMAISLGALALNKALADLQLRLLQAGITQP